MMKFFPFYSYVLELWGRYPRNEEDQDWEF